MTTLLFDCETTGLGDDAQIIEAAWLGLGLNLVKASWLEVVGFDGVREKRYRPSVPIQYGAMATHHIVADDLVDCPPSSEFALPPADYLVGHQIDFDWAMAGKPDCKRICTLALSRRLWPDLDSHSQGALLYYLLGPVARDRLVGAHSAAQDVTNCLTVLQAIWGQLKRTPDSWETLWLYSEKARVPTHWPVGKHRGDPIDGSDPGYLHWWLEPGRDADPYLLEAVRRALGRTS